MRAHLCVLSSTRDTSDSRTSVTAFASCAWSDEAHIMARGIPKPDDASLRTRLLVFTLSLAMTETRDLPSIVFDVPGVPHEDAVRVLWMVSYQMVVVISRQRYLTANRRPRYKCADWYTTCSLAPLTTITILTCTSITLLLTTLFLCKTIMQETCLCRVGALLSCQ